MARTGAREGHSVQCDCRRALLGQRDAWGARLGCRDFRAGQLLIEFAASGVCGSDPHLLLDRWRPPEFAPGHEVSGVVPEIGP
ncbi:MAG: alcohol dehydrogenase catalytic domain-containing protein [Armatimonadetes bacterium]|nr:alcohol dehydrogenase catalytic domain-containing protein [Armatimonadota bacterium]